MQIIEAIKTLTPEEQKIALSKEIEGDIIVDIEVPARTVPAELLYTIRMLREQGAGAKEELEDGRTLEIVEFFNRESVALTKVRFSA